MNKLIIIVSTLLISFSSNSQTHKITYNYKILEDEVMLKNDLLKDIFLENIKAANNIKFNLDFNDTISRFKIQEIMASDELDIDGAIATSGCQKEIFTFNKKTYRNNAESLFNENEYLIVDSIEKNWKYTNEKKLIDGYECYKATTENIIKNSYGEFHHPVIAWYCPEIPYQYGPAGYGGLPGLILQLQVRYNLFGAEKIELNSTNKKLLKIPNQGEVISNELFNKKISDIMENRFKNKN